jgi:hypothetical protein
MIPGRRTDHQSKSGSASTIRIRMIRTGWILLTFMIVCSKSYSQQSPSWYFVDSLQSVGDYVQENFEKFVTPEYRERRQLLQSCQQRGYSAVLFDVLRRDGISAFLSYIKSTFQIEFSLNHAPLYGRTVNGGLLYLPFDWTFPDDPWKKVPPR